MHHRAEEQRNQHAQVMELQAYQMELLRVGGGAQLMANNQDQQARHEQAMQAMHHRAEEQRNQHTQAMELQAYQMELLRAGDYQVGLDQSINNSNLSMKLDQLKTSNNKLIEERHHYNNVTQERDQLQTSYNNLAKERDQLHTSNNNLTQEKDQLEKEVHRLKKGGLLANSTACLPGWKSYGGSCYLFSSCKKTWTDSRQDCLNRDADLVIINSKEEQNFVNNFCCAVWIGLHDFETESIWKWVDGSPLTWKSWAKGEPNNAGNEDCAELQPKPKTWNDV
ncbi:hypothetical protein CRUP_007533, partial [Coryphaenoides rupestris]